MRTLCLGCCLQDGSHPEQEVSDRTFGVNRVKGRRKRADFDGDVGPGNRLDVVLVQAVVGFPSGSNAGQSLDHVEVPLQIDVGFRITHTCFTEEIH